MQSARTSISKKKWGFAGDVSGRRFKPDHRRTAKGIPVRSERLDQMRAGNMEKSLYGLMQTISRSHQTITTQARIDQFGEPVTRSNQSH